VPKVTKENKILRQDILSPGWDLTPEPAEIQHRRATWRMETYFVNILYLNPISVSRKCFVGVVTRPRARQQRKCS
jgi:hypothetical protein